MREREKEKEIERDRKRERERERRAARSHHDEGKPTYVITRGRKNEDKSSRTDRVKERERAGVFFKKGTVFEKSTSC